MEDDSADEYFQREAEYDLFWEDMKREIVNEDLPRRMYFDPDTVVESD